MSKLALYRKYRSTDLSDIVGQSHVTATLEASLKKGQVAHAYLFSGPRGVGKTSIARILARRINKLTADQDLSKYLDVIEIDAASNRGIDDVRALREKLNSAPTQLEYKIIIIDEVHMLTKEAFNALLKTLEEPPSHVIFVLATTEAHKLPLTIISRTQRFEFKPFTEVEIADHLKNISQQEKINYNDQGLMAIASLAGGSMRDAISILDQLAALNKKLDEKIIQELMGISSNVQLQKIYDAIINGDLKRSLELISQEIRVGVDESMLTSQLQRYFRDQLLKKSNDQPFLSNHTYAIETLIKANEHQKYTHINSLALEIAVSKIAQKFGIDSKKTNTNLANDKINNITSMNSQTKANKASVEKKPLKDQGSDNQNSRYLKALSIIKEHNNSLYALLKSGNARLVDDKLIVDCRFNFHKQRIEEPRNRETIEKIMSKVCHKQISLQCSVNSEPPQATATADPKKEIIDSAMAILGGELIDG